MVPEVGSVGVVAHSSKGPEATPLHQVAVICEHCVCVGSVAGDDGLECVRLGRRECVRVGRRNMLEWGGGNVLDWGGGNVLDWGGGNVLDWGGGIC